MQSTAFRRVLILYATPAILLIVACGQRYIAFASNLSSWQGGGFGMFAELPPFETRKMSTILVTANQTDVWLPPYQIETRVPLDGRMPRIHREILAMPSESRLTALAQELANAEWVGVPQVVENTTRVLPQLRTDYAGDPRAATSFPLSAVRMEIREYQLDSPGEQLVRRKLISVAAQPQGVGHATGR